MDTGRSVNSRKIGRRSMVFPSRPEIAGAAAVAGVKEGKGPQARWFDLILQDDYYGEKTFEKAESKMLRTSVRMALEDAGMERRELDVILSGDLLNQLRSSSFMARDLGIPFLGMYGACSTMTQSILTAAILADGGYISSAAAGASSHFATAERQFRMPLEHGNQRPPQAQWTATAAGAVILCAQDRTDPQKAPVQNRNMTYQAADLPENPRERKICVTHGTIGRIIDPGISDANSMGSAMAPAAYDTIRTHLDDLGRVPRDYDLILTGDLGITGKRILLDMMNGKMKDFDSVYEDCGVILYDQTQDAHAGGSGCGCSAAIMAGRIIKELREARLRRVMLISTGAFLSTISCQQGETIPGIAHAVTLEVF